MYCKNSYLFYEVFKLKLCTCARSHALGTRTKFQLEILNMNVIFGIAYFREIILKSSRNVSETAPGLSRWCHPGVKWLQEPILSLIINHTYLWNLASRHLYFGNFCSYYNVMTRCIKSLRIKENITIVTVTQQDKLNSEHTEITAADQPVWSSSFWRVVIFNS